MCVIVEGAGIGRRARTTSPDLDVMMSTSKVSRTLIWILFENVRDNIIQILGDAQHRAQHLPFLHSNQIRNNTRSELNAQVLGRGPPAASQFLAPSRRLGLSACDGCRCDGMCDRMCVGLCVSVRVSVYVCVSVEILLTE